MEIRKYLIEPARRRCIKKGFAFIPHKFLFDGYFSVLSKEELSLYFLLVSASDKDGLSYFSYTKICNILRIDVEEYIRIRNSLIEKSLIAFDGFLYQVLSLPDEPSIDSRKLLKTKQDFILNDPATVRNIVEKEFYNK